MKHADQTKAVASIKIAVTACLTAKKKIQLAGVDRVEPETRRGEKTLRENAFAHRTRNIHH